MRGYEFRLAKAQRGLAMVEFAIALPLLILLLLAVAEFGRMLYSYNSLMQASRDAARFVAGQAWNSTLGRVELTDTLKSQARNIAVYGLPVASSAPVLHGLTTDEVFVEIDPGSSDHVRVRVSYEFQPVIGDGIPAVLGGKIPLQIPLVVTTVMRAL